MIGAKIANMEHGGDRKSVNQGANLPLDKISQSQASKMLNVSVVTHQVANLQLDIKPSANWQKVSQPEAAKMLSIKSLVFHFCVSI